MVLSTAFRTILTLVAVLPVVACQKPKIVVAPPTPELTAYVATAAHQAMTLQSAQASGRWQMAGCTHDQSFSPSQITYAAGPTSYAPDGRPLDGIWMEQVAASGCGQRMLLNVAWLVGNGKMSNGPMAPGKTRADPIVQSEAARIAFLIAEKKVPSCAGKRSYVYDTAVDPALPATLAATWSERWTISSCDKHVVVPISFIPDGKGGFFIKGESAGAVVE